MATSPCLPEQGISRLPRRSGNLAFLDTRSAATCSCSSPSAVLRFLSSERALTLPGPRDDRIF